ncbi:MAG: response regulator [Bryobacteraceae bacterium]
MKKILLADDEENLRELVRTTLEDPDFEILDVPDGEQAVAVAQAERPDLIVLDWMMPGLTGPEVARKLRAIPDFADTPIVLLTAKGQDEDRRAGVEAGATCYLVKPFSPIELMEIVQELVT